MMKELTYPGKPYKGKRLQQPQGHLMPYFPEAGLVQAVEVARFLRRPLLLRGEPGCGKTRLAEAVAYELYGEEYRKYFFPWPIKSTSKAQEGIYTFDHLNRLRDVQDQSLKEKPAVETYVRYGPIGRAFQTSTEETPAVLLIDEIDKADIDFPNDLLNELEWQPEKVIEVPEGETRIQVRYPPIVFITSNDERELPAAFLRRCVFYYIDFPDKKDLIKIAQAYLKSFKDQPLDADEVKKLIDEFLELRADMDAKAVTDKKPSTSELLDWLFTHAYYELHGGLDEQAAEKLRFPGVLIKTETDFRAQMGKKSNG